MTGIVVSAKLFPEMQFIRLPIFIPKKTNIILRNGKVLRVRCNRVLFLNLRTKFIGKNSTMGKYVPPLPLVFNR